MRSKKQLLLDLSQDLYRISMGRHRGQRKMSETFAKEAKDRLTDIGDFKYSAPIQTALNSDNERSAEDLLMYSVLVKNYSLSSKEE